MTEVLSYEARCEKGAGRRAVGNAVTSSEYLNRIRGEFLDRVRSMYHALHTSPLIDSRPDVVYSICGG